LRKIGEIDFFYLFFLTKNIVKLIQIFYNFDLLDFKK